MTDRCAFTVYGPPQGKGRPRFGKGRTYTPAKTRSYEAMVATVAKAAMLGCPAFEGACSLAMVAFMPVPASWNARKRTAALEGTLIARGKPDADNAIKGIADSLNGIVYRDDAQISEVHFAKRYSNDPRVEISVVHLEAGDRKVPIYPLEAA